MAYDKIIPIRQRMDNCLGYVLNEDKNSLDYALTYAENPQKSHQLVTGINCQADTAYSEMQMTKRRWDKRGGILGYHIIHSYAPGEVTPEEAHAAGVEFARRLLGNRYEVVISTHIDREHLHCHIVFNSVSFLDGRKYRSDFQSYFGTLRETSNAVSRDHGLSVIEGTGQGRHYAEWEAERTGKTTIRGLIRQDIDAAIGESFTFETFLTALRRQGYSIKYGPNTKHTALCPPGGQRFFRLDGMGERYTEAAIRERLAAIRRGEREELPIQPMELPKRYTIRRGALSQTSRKKVRGFRALYVSYLYLLHIRRPRGKQVPFPIRAEVAKLRRYQRQFNLLQEYHIDNDGQFSMLTDALQAQIDGLTTQRKALYQEKRTGREVTAEIEAIHKELRRVRSQLKLCGQIKADIPHIRTQMEEYRIDTRREQEERHQRQRHAATDKGRSKRHFDPVR